MTLLQTQSPAAVLSLLGREYTAQLRSCEDCAGPAHLSVTPNPCYGTQPNAAAGWIGYYAVRCPRCQVHFPGEVAAPGGAVVPATLADHRAALQSAVDSWNSLAAAGESAYAENSAAGSSPTLTRTPAASAKPTPAWARPWPPCWQLSAPTASWPW